MADTVIADNTLERKVGKWHPDGSINSFFVNKTIEAGKSPESPMYKGFWVLFMVCRNQQNRGNEQNILFKKMEEKDWDAAGRFCSF